MIRFSLAGMMGPAAIALLLGSPVARAAGESGEKVPIILDCDIGTDIDDTFAVALALTSPEIDLRGITTVSGDTRARALMVCRILSAIDRGDVPVAAGRPESPPQGLRGHQGQYARHPAVIYNRTSRPARESAVELIYQKLKAEPGKITLVTVGPLSNIAELLTTHPDCKPWIKRIITMGGSVRVGYSNKPPIQAEFNIRADPRAAQVVFSSGVPLVLAPLDATTMLELHAPRRARIFGARRMLNYQIQALFQLWDQKAHPVLYDPVAVALTFTERFCKMEDLHLEVDDGGFTRESKGKPNARVATSIDKEAFLDWIVERFATLPEKASQPRPVTNVTELIPPDGFPTRVHAFEDYETDIERRWWMTGKPETANVPEGSTRACRGVLTLDFDGKMGDVKTMYNSVVFNPVPGPPMGKKPRVSFRYWLKGTDTLRVQVYSLSNGYHRFLTVRGLPQERWETGVVDMTAARRPDGGGGPLAENERIDDIQFYTDPEAELIIDDVVLYDAAADDEKKPFPTRLAYTGWFDTGKQGSEWPGSFAILDHKGHFWDAARSVPREGNGPWIRLHLRGQRPIWDATHLFFRYHLKGADTLRVVLRNSKTGSTREATLKGLKTDSWASTVANLSTPSRGGDGKGETVDEIHFLLPSGAELLIDDVLLHKPGKGS